MVRERQIGGVCVYYTCRRFPSQHMAREMWEYVERKSAGKGLDLGLYRHGPSTLPGTTITALSLDLATCEKADWYLRRGADVDPYDDPHVSLDEIDALIARRGHVALTRDGENHLEWRYGGEGRRMLPDGTYDDGTD